MSCDDSENTVTDKLIITSKSSEELKYIEYQDALIISNQLINESMLYLSNIEYSGQSEDDLIEGFYRQSDVLSNLSQVIDLDTEIVSKNFTQFDSDIGITDINNSEYLNFKQKEYAKKLLIAVENNDFDELVSIKDSFKLDVSLHPELEIFNSGIALIESAQSYADINYSYTTFGDDDCLHAAMVSGVMGGVAGMIFGAIQGGISGAVIGGVLTGGTLTVAAGAGGAMVGATVDGFLGFIGGAILGYLGCLLFGN